jgi:hypothetical protein
METPNTPALTRRWSLLGAAPGEILRVYRSFNAAAPAFQKESEAHEPDADDQG